MFTLQIIGVFSWQVWPYIFICVLCFMAGYQYGCSQASKKLKEKHRRQGEENERK